MSTTLLITFFFGGASDTGAVAGTWTVIQRSGEYVVTRDGDNVIIDVGSGPLKQFLSRQFLSRQFACELFTGTTGTTFVGVAWVEELDAYLPGDFALDSFEYGAQVMAAR